MKIKLVSERLRLRLESSNPEGRGAGFVTLHTWASEMEAAASTESTPTHAASGEDEEEAGRRGGRGHRRSNSLPPVILHRWGCLSVRIGDPWHFK